MKVLSRGKTKRVPVDIAGRTMVCIQSMLDHVGSYLISNELGLHSHVSDGLRGRFTLYLNANGGMSFDSSAKKADTEGYGDIVSDAIELMGKTMDALSSGAGCSWMDDNYTVPIYRDLILNDLAELSAILPTDGQYYLEYGTGELNTFGNVSRDKIDSFKNEHKCVNCKEITGLLEKTSLGFGLRHGYGMADVTFSTQALNAEAEKHIGKPVRLDGTARYEDGTLREIEPATAVRGLGAIYFTRMISVDGDVSLKSPLEARVGYESGLWTLTTSDLGISISKESWDEAVCSYHDYFVFLWTQYTGDPADDLSEEEIEVRETLLSLVK